VKLFARWRWPLVEGRVIDKRHIKKFLARYDSTSQLVSVDDYMVELPGPDGQPKRLVVRAQSARLPPKGVNVGDVVPLHANPARTKAVFGRFGPHVSRAERRRRDRERRARDDARFRSKLDER
jgi:hypothetical protein